VGAPDQPRQHLQWLRVTMALREANLGLLTPQVRKLAGDGGAEAQFLLYQLNRANPDVSQSSMMEVSREEGLKALHAAAEQGHMSAIGQLIMLYRGVYGMRRDLRQVVRWARRMESAPPQGIATTDYENETRAAMPMVIARTTLEEDGFPATEQRAAFRFVDGIMKAGGKDANEAADAVVSALRAGRGTSKNPARAREILEERIKTDGNAVPILAQMLLGGEGGPEDGKRALELVSRPDQQKNGVARGVKAEILLAGNIVGYRPQEAIQALAGTYEVDNAMRLAGLMIDYRTRLDNPEGLVTTLSRAAETRSDAALALARLKLSENSQFSDEDGARMLLKPLADAGGREAFWLYMGTQYRNLASTSYQPMRRDDGPSDAELMSAIDEGIAKEEPQAFLLKARLLRRGVVYPQDDRAASDMLRQAARRDNVEALLLLGDAYDDGLGIAKDKKKRLDAWRRAAQLGSLQAKSKIASAFTFDSFDRLMTLEEGVTWRIALYNNGYGRSFDGMNIFGESAAEMEFMGLFMGRAMEAGTDAVAEAVMNAFHQAPAGLDDKNLVGIGKALPPEIRTAIEKRLARDGVYQGSPEGYWGPEARKALAAWVKAKGFDAAPADVSVATSDDQPSEEVELVSKETIGRTWDKIRAEFQAAKNDRQKRGQRPCSIWQYRCALGTASQLPQARDGAAGGVGGGNYPLWAGPDADQAAGRREDRVRIHLQHDADLSGWQGARIRPVGHLGDPRRQEAAGSAGARRCAQAVHLRARRLRCRAGLGQARRRRWSRR
jgi:TPR repeat protein